LSAQQEFLEFFPCLFRSQARARSTTRSNSATNPKIEYPVAFDAESGDFVELRGNRAKMIGDRCLAERIGDGFAAVAAFGHVSIVAKVFGRR